MKYSEALPQYSFCPTEPIKWHCEQGQNTQHLNIIKSWGSAHHTASTRLLKCTNYHTLFLSCLFTWAHSLWHTGSTRHATDHHASNTAAVDQRYLTPSFTALLPAYLSLLLSFKFSSHPPPREWEKLFSEKRIIIICGGALESNVLESCSNYRLWQMGPAASTLPLRSPRRPTDKCRRALTQSLSLALLQQHSGVSSHNINLEQSFKSQRLIFRWYNMSSDWGQIVLCLFAFIHSKIMQFMAYFVVCFFVFFFWPSLLSV